MAAEGNKKPKKDKSGKHIKHVPSYKTESESTKPDMEAMKKKK
jgi:hypothetical protein